MTPDNSGSSSSFKNNPFPFIYVRDKLKPNKAQITHNSSFYAQPLSEQRRAARGQRLANRVEIHFLVARVSTFSDMGSIPTATEAAQINADPGQLPVVTVVIGCCDLQHMWRKNTLMTCH